MTAIHNGEYTVKSLRTGEHRTFRVRTWRRQDEKDPIKRSIELLTGLDNTSSYTGFGFVNEDRIVVWRRYRGTRFEKLARCFESLVVEGAESRFAHQAEVLEARHCLLCNRLLTEPQSIEAGIGPVCAGRL